ncbi:hypothetical protein MAR_001559 [Mya arenaria]|uniref:Uncharacterized protein n=1 Tax=Mya arenaria TaxID=6604 RepID=A0ABY7FKH5_MYAAR|nr:hypothetical protein MAR_001559 [Mya arenaria]
MSTFLCVLLLGVILVASVQGLTKDQLQQILENGKDIVIELPGFWWIPKGNNVKDPAPWCQSHSSGASCCVQRTMHVRGKKYHLNVNMNEVEECFSASSLVPGSKICIKLYKICTKHKHMCAALEGKAVIKGVEKNVKLDYGCFQIGSGDENDDAQVPDGMETEEQATKAEMFRALSAQLDLSDGGEETSSIEDDTLRFEN